MGEAAAGEPAGGGSDTCGDGRSDTGVKAAALGAGKLAGAAAVQHCLLDHVPDEIGTAAMAEGGGLPTNGEGAGRGPLGKRTRSSSGRGGRGGGVHLAMSPAARDTVNNLNAGMTYLLACYGGDEVPVTQVCTACP